MLLGIGALTGAATPSDDSDVRYTYEFNPSKQEPKEPMAPEKRKAISRYAYRNLPSYEERQRQLKRQTRLSAPGMDTCRNAPGADREGGVIIDRSTWCMVVPDAEVRLNRCTPNPPVCTMAGRILFRISVMGIGRTGPAEADRKTELWIQVDNFRPSGEKPPWDAKLKFEGANCDVKTPNGPKCNVRNDGRNDTLRNWSQPPSDDWATFSSPEGNLTGDKVANYTFGLNATVEYGPGHETEHHTWKGGPFRCDSAIYVGSSRGCVFDDDEPVTYRFDSRPGWKEQTDHVWEAQKTPNRTKPSSKFDKVIPGSPQSKNPLTRRFDKDTSSNNDKEKNRRKSRRQCQKYFGRNYATAIPDKRRDCDEYPYASTYEGSDTGVNTIDPNDGYRHFSVKAISSKHNQDAGNDLENSFYKVNRMLDGDEFYVHLVTPSGGDYNGPDKPSGVAAPVTYHQCSAAPAVEAKQAKPKAYPEDLFNKYAATTRDGWTGGDSTYSVTLPDGRRLWLFSDTFLGPLNDNGTRPTSAPLINSTFVSQVGDNLSTITGADRKAIMPPSAEKHWYWLGDGLVSTIGGEKKLQVIFHEWHKFGSGDWDFKIKQSLVATFDLADLTEPESMQPLPSEAGVQWGSAVMSAEQSGDGYTYIYGTDDAPINKGMRIARVKGTNVSDPDKWQYLNSGRGQWMYGETEGDNALIGVANEYSVTPYKGNYVLISQDSTEAFSGKVRLWSGCDPYGVFGSWEGHDVVYRMPEPGPYGDCTEGQEDGRCFAYNAHVPPSLASGGRWIMSYNVNNFDNNVTPTGAHYRDPTIYRPRFVSFTLESSTVTRQDAKMSYGIQPPDKSSAPCRPEHRPPAGVFPLPGGKTCS
ncbi:NucA/NucB deoxyribonuclease domain-containing protein [Streptomyces sp. NPDC002564]|uniref:NucA/NucB deoxyribonuclease domain-containing protein n=1 Tax=Streptomyces sp. NPDC002564 TaxID=3364649 RepID=UPI0036B51EB8